MSQDYTPVSWVDETTSQQGTLINAARLNQMQTAHHYADGFEEVDAIPTEDPGVDYHKVVYCTADATFYRWDGTQWTADIDEETKHLLDLEIARAEHAEGLIQGYLDAHEANHNNPHQVTKAQVGLGNCDNTADLDKPISTAAQAALDTKADEATTLAGYGITDAYTKTEADTLLAAKADNSAVVHNTGNETIRGLKTIKADNVALLALQTAAASGEIGAFMFQDKNGISKATLQANTDGEIELNPTGGRGAVVYRDLVISKEYGGGGSITADSITADTITGSLTGPASKLGTADLGTDTKPIKLVAGVPTAVTNDLATQTFVGAALDGYAAMVRTTGNQTIEGVKTFYSSAYTEIDIKSARVGMGENIGGIRFINGNNVTGAYISGRVNGSVIFDLSNSSTKAVSIPEQRAYNAANTSDIATIGTLDAYSPMVRTSGNQTILGTKLLPETVVGTKMINRVATTHALEVLSIANPTGGLTYLIHLIVSGRFDLALMRVAVVINSDATAVTSVSTTAQGIYALSNTRQIVAGARINNGKLKLSLRAKSGNTSISAMPMNCNVDGLTQTIDLSEYGNVTAISNMTGYVEEA